MPCLIFCNNLLVGLCFVNVYTFQGIFQTARVLFLKCKSNQVFPAYNPSISRGLNQKSLAWHIISFVIWLLLSLLVSSSTNRNRHSNDTVEQFSKSSVLFNVLLSLGISLPSIVFINDSYMSHKTHSGSHHHLPECLLPSHRSQAEEKQEDQWSPREVGEGGREDGVEVRGCRVQFTEIFRGFYSERDGKPSDAF